LAYAGANLASWSSRSRGMPRSWPSLRICLQGTRFLRRPSIGTRDHLAPQSGQSQLMGSTETRKRPAAIHLSCEWESRTEALAWARRSNRSCRRASVIPFLALALSAALLALRSTRLIPLVRMCPTRTSEYKSRREMASSTRDTNSGLLGRMNLQRNFRTTMLSEKTFTL
jgi:hypothetical protein